MSSRVKALLVCMTAVVTTVNAMNTTATFDVVHVFPQSWGVGNLMHFGNFMQIAMICTVTGSNEMWFKLNDEHIAYITAGSGVGMEETFGTNGGHFVRSVIWSVSNTTDPSFSVLFLFQVELGPDGYGTATCMSYNNRDDRVINTTWNNSLSENCNGSITLCNECYNNVTASFFSCYGDELLFARLNSQILNKDPAIINSQCNPGNNTCSSKVLCFLIINNEMGTILVSELVDMRCVGRNSYVEVNTSSTAVPVSTTPTPPTATTISGGHAAGIDIAATIILAAVTVGWIRYPLYP